MQFTLSQEDYEALIALARKGATTQDQILNLDRFLQKIEASNGVRRHIVIVQWQEQDQPLPPGTTFPRAWPPELRERVEFISRPVSRTDVDAVIKSRAKKPTSILCTKDPAGVVGWTPIDQFFSI